MQKSKIILFHINIEYVNPWVFNFIEVLKKIFDVKILYPENINEEKDYLKIDNYDFVFSTLNFFSFVYDENIYFKKYIKNISSNNLINFISNYKLIINQARFSILISDIDHFHASKKMINEIEKSNSFVIGRNIEFFRSKEKMYKFNLRNEIFYKLVNNNWRNFVKDNKTRIIALQGTLSENEFLLEYNFNKKYQISVPGALYFQRKKIIDTIKKSNIKTYLTSPFFNKILRITSINKYKSNFIKSIKNSTSCYTNGSALGYPIRKYFEIPANKSLLLCEPFEGFEHYGFKDGKNCLIVDENDILDKFYEFTKDNNKLMKIINQAYNLIYENHSVEARSRQLQESINKILKKNFNGSAWIKGKYVHF